MGLQHIVDHDKQQLTQFWSALDTIQEHSLTLNLSRQMLARQSMGLRRSWASERSWGSEQDDPRGLFGALFTGPETDWRKILNALRWVQEVRAHLGEPASAFFTNRLGIAPLIDEDWVSLEAVVANIDEVFGISNDVSVLTGSAATRRCYIMPHSKASQLGPMACSSLWTNCKHGSIINGL